MPKGRRGSGGQPIRSPVPSTSAESPPVRSKPTITRPIHARITRSPVGEPERSGGTPGEHDV